MKLILTTLFVLGLSCCFLRAEDAALDKQIAGIAAQLGVEKEADREKPQVELEKLEMAASVPGKDAERTAYCKAVAGALGNELPVPAKLWLLRSLERVGRFESVGVEQKLLADPDENVCDAAMRALAHNSSEESAAILSHLILKSTEPKTRAALIDALGFKKNPAAQKLFAEESQNADEGVRHAARAALAKIGHRADSGAMQEAAALIDLARSGNAADIPKLIAGLEAPNIKVRQAAVQALSLCKAPEMTAALTQKLSAAPTNLKPALLTVLAQRGDKSALIAIIAELKSEPSAVRVAALKALGKIGDGTCVAPLIALAGSAKDDELRALRESLDLMKGGDVDQALIGFLSGGDALVKREAVQRLAARIAVSAAPALVKLLNDPDQNVRKEALIALGAVGGKNELPGVLVIFTSPLKEVMSDENVAKAALSISRRNPDIEGRAEALIAAFKDAPESAHGPLLNVLAQLGGTKALDVVRGALKSSVKSTQDGAVRALANWSGAAPLADLLNIAKSTENETHRVLALRGYFRLAGLPGERPAQKSFEIVEDGLKAAKKSDDKKMALAAFADIDDFAAFKQCEALLNEPEIAEEACAALAKSARFFIKSHGHEVAAAMQTVLAKTKNDATKKLATDMKNKAAKA